MDLHGFAVYKDLAAIGPVNSRQDFEQSRLAGAILPHERVNFPCTALKAYPLDGARRARGFSDVPHFQERRATRLLFFARRGCARLFVGFT